MTKSWPRIRENIFFTLLGVVLSGLTAPYAAEKADEKKAQDAATAAAAKPPVKAPPIAVQKPPQKASDREEELVIE